MSRLSPGRLALALLAVPVIGCGPSRDHERLGDRAYGEARYAEALAQYRTVLKGSPDAGVWAKVGAAALHVGELRQASDAYLHLAGEDPARAPEAAEGLESVARSAERAGNADVLQEVVTGMQAIAPDRPTGRYAMRLLRRPGADTTEVAALLPGALATATAPETVDSLLLIYGSALESTAGCGQALLQYRALLRRSQDAGLRTEGRRRVAGCAFALGERSDSAGRVEDAALWYAEAGRMDSTSVTGRRALLRYGVARLRQGDTLAAALAFQTIVAATGTDSSGTAAAGYLTALGMIQNAGNDGRTGDR